MLPDTSTAMRNLTQDIRRHIRFDELDASRVCNSNCKGCSKKLLEFLETEILYWEGELASGGAPALGDITKLARSAKKIHKVLRVNQIL